MKVICIDDEPKFPVNRNYKFIITFGERYEVIQVVPHERFGDCYELAAQPGVSYPSFHFAESSNIDETEFERNYKKELV